MGGAGADVWSRGARRRQGGGMGRGEKRGGGEGGAREPEEAQREEDEGPDDTLALVVHIQIRGARAQGEDAGRERAPAGDARERAQPHRPQDVEVRLRWLQGHDRVLWESFAGWLRRKLRTPASTTW